MTLLLLISSLAQAGDFMDVWVTTAFEDTNLLAGPEAYSPSANFVERGNRTFFENYESQTTDDISRANLVLYKRSDSYFEGWSAEAAFVLRYTPYLDPAKTKPGVEIKDDGSYVRLIRELSGKDHSVSLTGYAVDAGRFRLGYSYDLTWGGKEIFSFTTGAAPGVRLQWQKGGNYAYLGAKSSVGDFIYYDEETGYRETRNQAYYGMLGGAGLELAERLRLEAGAGTFDQGQILNITDTSSELYGAPINAFGVCGQLSYRTNPKLDFISSADLKLYRNSPDFVKDSYIFHRRLDGFGALVQTEANVLMHNLLDPETESSTVIERGLAADVQTVLVYNATNVSVDLVYKDLPYILFNIPGLTSGVALSEDMERTSQIYGRFQISHFFEKARTTPSLGIGMMQPATYTTTDGTFVQYTERDKERVPDGQAPAAILSSVAGVQVDMTPHVVLVGELLYTVDNNLSDYVETEDGSGGERVPAPANERNALGMNLMMRARF